MITAITGIVATNDINIENMLNKSRGDYAYTMLDVSDVDSEHIIAKLEEIDGVIRARVI